MAGDEHLVTDTELLDFLQKLQDEASYSEVCILRESKYGRGWRLHCHDGSGFTSVRAAIESFMREYNER